MSKQPTRAPKWITEHEAGKIVGVSGETMRRYRRDGIGPEAHRIGPRLIRYDRTVVEAWAANQRLDRPAQQQEQKPTGVTLTVATLNTPGRRGFNAWSVRPCD